MAGFWKGIKREIIRAVVHERRTTNKLLEIGKKSVRKQCMDMRELIQRNREIAVTRFKERTHGFTEESLVKANAVADQMLLDLEKIQNEIEMLSKERQVDRLIEKLYATIDPEKIIGALTYTAPGQRQQLREQSQVAVLRDFRGEKEAD